MASDPATSARMRRIRRRHTEPELLLRKLLWSQGIRYRCNDKKLPGSPDLVNRRQRWAIFVHGCFWHGHEDCKRSSTPKTNSAFWSEKIATNRRRDAAKTDALRRLGLEVIEVWECEVAQMAKQGLDLAPPQLLTLLHRLRHHPQRTEE